MVGELLKKRRDELGMDLHEIADTLKIRYDYLKAIEDGDLKKLPAEVYLKGYLLEYAKILKLDPKAIRDSYSHEATPVQDTTETVHFLEPPRKRFRISYVLIPVFAIFLVVILTNFLFSPSENPPRQPQMIVTTNVASSSLHEEHPTAPATGSDKPASQPDTGISTQRSEPLNLSEHTLEILAKDTTWLSVAIDNANPKEVLMQPGDSMKWHAQKSFILKIGNAGGIRLVFDGNEISELGSRGEVVSLKLPRQNT